VTLPGDEQAFLCHALAQLEPAVQPVFTARLVEHLQVIADPGPGDVDRALRAALVGLWVPPETIELRAVSRWDRDTPGFHRASKWAW
jgi:chloramphenicol 3-O-phosphotransferase